MDAGLFRKLSLLVTASIVASSVGSSQPRENSIENVFAENINDSISVQVKLQYDERGLPKHYFCHVNTPVCEEGLCKTMVLDVYWDVLGNFLNYELPSSEALTKFDHLPFTTEDHHKLRTILADRASILRDYPVKDLVDKRLLRKSEVVDAVTAATRVEVRDAVVNGAVYSTYVLWNIVNGTIASRIEEHTMHLTTDSLILQMFRSDNLYYQYFALNQYGTKDSLTYLPEVIGLVGRGVDYIPYFAIEKLPAWVWDHDVYQIALVQDFKHFDFKLKNAFLEKLSHRQVSVQVLDILLSTLDALTDRQQMKVLEIAILNEDRLSRDGRKTIEHLRRSQR